jgi:hypothetical protein
MQFSLCVVAFFAVAVQCVRWRARRLVAAKLIAINPTASGTTAALPRKLA